jgi:hypothetical protein
VSPLVDIAPPSQGVFLVEKVELQRGSVRLVSARGVLSVIAAHSVITTIGPAEYGADIVWETAFASHGFDLAFLGSEPIIYVVATGLWVVDLFGGSVREAETDWDVDIAAGAVGWDAGCDIYAPGPVFVANALAPGLGAEIYFVNATGLYRMTPALRTVEYVAKFCDEDNGPVAVTPDGSFAYVGRRSELLRVEVETGEVEVFAEFEL